jgi:long-chain acyl-CoA synthetase
MEMVDAKKMTERSLENIMATYCKQLNLEVPNFMQVNRFQVVDTEFEKTPKRSIKRFLYS